MTKKENTVVLEFHFCPECGSGHGHFYSGIELVCCADCDWKGNFSDMLSYEEMLNKQRSKKLNNILNGNN